MPAARAPRTLAQHVARCVTAPPDDPRRERRWAVMEAQAVPAVQPNPRRLTPERGERWNGWRGLAHARMMGRVEG